MRLGQVLLMLVMLVLIVRYFWWVAAAAAILALALALLRLAFYVARMVDARHHRRAALLARADEQHRWVMQGDDRGIYGPDGAPLMHYITTSQPGEVGLPRGAR